MNEENYVSQVFGRNLFLDFHKSLNNNKSSASQTFIDVLSSLQPHNMVVKYIEKYYVNHWRRLDLMTCEDKTQFKGVEKVRWQSFEAILELLFKLRNNFLNL